MNTAEHIRVSRLLREAGNVERCHVIPHLGSYTVGKHSYDALSLLLVLYPHPGPSQVLIKAMLWHDVPERWTGDLPAPVKWASGELAKSLQGIENRCYKAACIPMNELDPAERQWLDAVDKIELLLWAKEQLFLGNGNAATVIGCLARYFQDNEARMPKECVEFLKQHQHTRTADAIPG